MCLSIYLYLYLFPKKDKMDKNASFRFFVPRKWPLNGSQKEIHQLRKSIVLPLQREMAPGHDDDNELPSLICVSPMNMEVDLPTTATGIAESHVGESPQESSGKRHSDSAGVTNGKGQSFPLPLSYRRSWYSFRGLLPGLEVTTHNSQQLNVLLPWD